MMNQQKPSNVMHQSLWVAQIVLALFLLMGTVIKFMPIEKIAVMMPWTGQVPAPMVRIIGVVDLLGAVGLIFPALFRIKPNLTPWTAICIIVLMLCAILFHVARDEASSIGINIFSAILAAFVAWGRFMKVPIASK